MIICIYDDYIKQATNLVKDFSNEKKIRVSTFNMYYSSDSKTDTLMNMLRLQQERVKMVVGVSYGECTSGCSYCALKNTRLSDRLLKYKEDKFDFKIVGEHHMKYFSNGEKAIVGGMNLSLSGYTDMAYLVQDQKEVKKMDRYFDTMYKKLPKDFTYEKPEPIMPFGKYKGQFVRRVLEVDPKYIEWMLANIEPHKLEGLGLDVH